MADEPSEDQPRAYQPLFADGEPLRVADLAKATANSRPDDDEASATKSNGKRLKEKKGAAFPLTPDQWLHSVAAMSGTRQVAKRFDELIDDARQGQNRGRKRDYDAYDALIFLCGTFLYGGASGVHNKNFPHRAGGPAQRLVDQLNLQLEHDRPDDPAWRLNPKGFNRSQHRRVREDFLDDDVVDELERLTRQICVQAALRMGQFRPRAGTYTQPDTTQHVVADGTVVGGLYNNGDPDKINHGTGKPKRHDPEAFTPRSATGKKPKPPNYEWVLVITRTPHPKERIILAVNIKGEAQRSNSDATLAVDSLLQLIEEHPRIINGLYAFGYDGALAAEDRDRLLKAGVQPVSKLRRISETVPFIHNFGPHRFVHPNETVAHTAEVIAIDGNATVVMTDGDGHDCYVPLTCTNRRRTKQRTGGYAVNNTYALPQNPIVARHLQGATITMRMDTPAEQLREHDPDGNKKHKKNPTLHPQTLSAFPEADPHHQNLYGVRQDCESTNRHFKALLRDKRSITTTRNNNRYQAIGYQLLIVTSALLAHAERTGSQYTDIFGQRLVPPPEPTSLPTQLAA